MTGPTVDRDQLAALRVLRRQLGVVQVLAVLELQPVGRGSGGSRPRLTGHQLALTFEGGERSSSHESSTEAAGPEGRRRA